MSGKSHFEGENNHIPFDPVAIPLSPPVDTEAPQPPDSTTDKDLFVLRPEELIDEPAVIYWDSKQRKFTVTKTSLRTPNIVYIMNEATIPPVQTYLFKFLLRSNGRGFSIPELQKQFMKDGRASDPQGKEAKNTLSNLMTNLSGPFFTKDHKVIFEKTRNEDPESRTNSNYRILYALKVREDSFKETELAEDTQGKKIFSFLKQKKARR